MSVQGGLPLRAARMFGYGLLMAASLPTRACTRSRASRYQVSRSPQGNSTLIALQCSLLVTDTTLQFGASYRAIKRRRLANRAGACSVSASLTQYPGPLRSLCMTRAFSRETRMALYTAGRFQGMPLMYRATHAWQDAVKNSDSWTHGVIAMRAAAPCAIHAPLRALLLETSACAIRASTHFLVTTSRL